MPEPDATTGSDEPAPTRSAESPGAQSDAAATVETVPESAQALYTSAPVVEQLTREAREREYLPGEAKTLDRHLPEGDPGVEVLDVGCGAGRMSGLLRERGFAVTGTDVSRPLVERARSLFPDVDFLLDDVAESSLASNAFDHAVFADIGLDYLAPESRRLDALRELRRVLRPGGRLVFSSHNGWATVANALTGEVSPLRERYVERREHNSLRSRYVVEEVVFGVHRVYYSNPLRQRRQLREAGFELVDVVGKRDGPLRFLERAPHYVARAGRG